MRNLFFFILIIGTLILGFFSFLWPAWFWAFLFWVPLCIWGLYDVFQPRHSILRNFPLLGNMRWILESIAPEIQQYFIERTTDGKPFSRNQRSLAYRRSKNVSDTTPFGTQLELNNATYEGLRHSIFPTEIMEKPPKVLIGEGQCAQPYHSSIFNISAMSFGALSNNAIMALNRGAEKGHFSHNTGEGGISSYHIEGGGDLVWQIGTGYFGCRAADGTFSPEKYKVNANRPSVKMIELKLSQGAKPGHGGVLPGTKNTPEIAEIRGIEPYETVLSPPGHRAFLNFQGMLNFIDELRELSGGKPVGIKLCIGKTEEFTELCDVMKETGQYPDFITVDGAEGGTGAAPLEFSDAVGLPLEPALIFVSETLKRYDLKQKIKIIAGGKVISASNLLKMLALGANICNSARGFMFSLGCIQALRCNTNDCPAGVATQDKMLVRGLVVTDKSERVYHFHRNTIHAAMELMAACGKSHLEEVDIHMFVRGDEFVAMQDRFFPDKMEDISVK
ncbi:MAG: glutamate synthase domain-containing protein 2 [Sphingobacteriales bacterium]|jgi:glutamate synthase domain-containing protein 2